MEAIAITKSIRDFPLKGSHVVEEAVVDYLSSEHPGAIGFPPSPRDFPILFPNIEVILLLPLMVELNVLNSNISNAFGPRMVARLPHTNPFCQICLLPPY